jgi:1-aminocyclopropane-1-carboxylate deaminase
VRVTPSLRLRLPSPLVELSDERLARRGVQLLLKRDDLIHPELSGNKWRKLKHVFSEVERSGQATVLSFGGPYSNHIRALAAAGRFFGFSTIGIIRGEERPLNSSLVRATEDGMRLHYVDRATYRRKRDPDFIAGLRANFGDFFLVPEGGSTPSALPGVAELVREIDRSFEQIFCPVGTGTTLAGLAAALEPSQRAIGIAALKGQGFLTDEVAALQTSARGHVTGNWSVDERFHFGGFARRTPELMRFIEDFRRRHSILLDWTYVAKTIFGVFALVEEGAIAPGSTVVALITGSPSPPQVECAPNTTPPT